MKHASVKLGGVDTVAALEIRAVATIEVAGATATEGRAFCGLHPDPYGSSVHRRTSVCQIRFFCDRTPELSPTGPVLIALRI